MERARQSEKNEDELDKLIEEWTVNHSEIGVTAYDSPSFRLSKTPTELRMPTPLREAAQRIHML
jgi:hypothetical protein